MNKIICGIDLGGTKIEGVLLELSDNDFKVLERLRVPTEKEGGYQHILSRIKLVVEKLQDKTGIQIQKLGIGTPGTLDPLSQKLKNSNTVCLNGEYFKRDLEATLGFPIEMANDANCFALAEATLGAVPDVNKDAVVVFGIILGTGVGGGVVINKKVLHGCHGIGGEWGHNFLDESGGSCFCGLTGCVETIISGTGLENFYESQTGHRISLKKIMALYEEGNDFNATATVERLLHFFGKAIAPIINVIDPDVIVIGGGVGNIDLIYKEGIKTAKKYVFNSDLKTRFVKPKLGDSAGVFGAAMLIS